MALLCDLLVCTRDVRLGVPETGLGAIPGVGGTQTLPRAIGAGRAAALLLLGEWIDGREAERLGFANHAVAPAGLETVVRRLALRLSRIEPAVVRAVKESLRRGRDLPLPQALGLERRLASKLRVEAP
jgi:enoyl-CoA hydratase/carnithine racemase